MKSAWLALFLLASLLVVGCISQPLSTGGTDSGTSIEPAPELPADAQLTDSDLADLDSALDELDDTIVPDSGVDDSTFETG